MIDDLPYDILNIIFNYIDNESKENLMKTYPNILQLFIFEYLDYIKENHFGCKRCNERKVYKLGYRVENGYFSYQILHFCFLSGA